MTLRSSAARSTVLSLVKGAVGESDRVDVLVEGERKDFVARMAGFRERGRAGNDQHCRFGCMLALLSMSKPTVTGVSVSVKQADGLCPAILDDAECLLRQAGDVRTSPVLDRHVQNHELRVCRKDRRLLTRER